MQLKLSLNFILSSFINGMFVYHLSGFARGFSAFTEVCLKVYVFSHKFFCLLHLWTFAQIITFYLFSSFFEEISMFILYYFAVILKEKLRLLFQL